MHMLFIGADQNACDQCCKFLMRTDTTKNPGEMPTCQLTGERPQITRDPAEGLAWNSRQSIPVRLLRLFWCIWNAFAGLLRTVISPTSG